MYPYDIIGEYQEIERKIKKEVSSFKPYLEQIFDRDDAFEKSVYFIERRQKQSKDSKNKINDGSKINVKKK